MGSSLERSMIGKSSEPLEPVLGARTHLAFQRAEPCIQTREGICLGGAGEGHRRVVHMGQSASFLKPDEEHGS